MRPRAAQRVLFATTIDFISLNQPSFVLCSSLVQQSTPHYACFFSVEIAISRLCSMASVFGQNNKQSESKPVQMMPSKRSERSTVGWEQAAMEKVKADKEREVKDGHDGTWIAHPALLPIAKQVTRRGPSNDVLDR